MICSVARPVQQYAPWTWRTRPLPSVPSCRTSKRASCSHTAQPTASCGLGCPCSPASKGARSCKGTDIATPLAASHGVFVPSAAAAHSDRPAAPASSRNAAAGSSALPVTRWSHRHACAGAPAAKLASAATTPTPAPRTCASATWACAITQHRWRLHTCTATQGDATPLPALACSYAAAARTCACALVPWKANELAPANSPSPPASAPRTLPKVARPSAPLPLLNAPATCVLTARKCTTAAASRCFTPLPSAWRSPVAPAAGSVCPRLDFTAPKLSAAPLVAAVHGGDCSSTALAAPTSIGSPRGVPVPCSSSAPTALPSACEAVSAHRSTRCCDGPFGAVKALDLPSWFTAEPATPASARWPARSPPTSHSCSSAHASPRT
mmetsp:Transcript_3011/g.10601  ORF Transcript_3011/g.10601 Transcript_3011/m.10601 type:complete len:382 (+) Transcript_3011:1124-2269(+)